MDFRVQQIKNAFARNKYLPRFYGYYETNRNLRPKKNEITMYDEERISKELATSTNPKSIQKSKALSFDNNKNLAIVGVSFLASSALTILVHATSILDNFGEPVKKLSRFGLSFLSLALGTIGSAGIINSNFKGKRDLE